jgi:hypothetical protein
MQSTQQGTKRLLEQQGQQEPQHAGQARAQLLRFYRSRTMPTPKDDASGRDTVVTPGVAATAPSRIGAFHTIPNPQNKP